MEALLLADQLVSYLVLLPSRYPSLGSHPTSYSLKLLVFSPSSTLAFTSVFSSSSLPTHFFLKECPYFSWLARNVSYPSRINSYEKWTSFPIVFLLCFQMNFLLFFYFCFQNGFWSIYGIRDSVRTNKSLLRLPLRGQYSVIATSKPASKFHPDLSHYV